MHPATWPPIQAIPEKPTAFASGAREFWTRNEQLDATTTTAPQGTSFPGLLAPSFNTMGQDVQRGNGCRRQANMHGSQANTRRAVLTGSSS
jgi:hypothetical protein